MRTQKDFLFLLGSLLIITIGWIFFTIQHNALQSTISESIDQDITAITPQFDTAVITKLQARKVVDPSYSYVAATATLNTIQQASPTATPTIVVTPTPTIFLTPTPPNVQTPTVTP